jgi:hypothetical protein
MTATNFTIPLGTQVIGDGGSSITVDGKAYRSSVSFTRPSNTTSYTAGDVLGSASSALFSVVVGPALGENISGGLILIQSVELIFSDSSVPSGMGAFRVHFYTSAPTVTADNAPFDLTSSERALYVGYVDLPAPQDFGSTLYTQVDYPGRLIQLETESNSLIVEIETRGAYTPVSASTVELRVATLEAGI